MARTIAVSSSLLASQVRVWRGTAAFRPARRQPGKLLELYDFEACPHCRLVREALTEMDLDALILPCPKGGQRFRSRARELGGKLQFPYLVDPNTGTALHESRDIIRYLADTYEGRAPRSGALRRAIDVATSELASAARGLRGLRARASQSAQQPLELFSFESSPYSRLVRELLCELELPYVLRNMGKARWEDMGPPSVRRRWFGTTPVEGRNRNVLMARTGRMQVPYLADPNTGAGMFESADILAYLHRTYAAARV